MIDWKQRWFQKNIEEKLEEEEKKDDRKKKKNCKKREERRRTNLKYFKNMIGFNLWFCYMDRKYFSVLLYLGKLTNINYILW